MGIWDAFTDFFSSFESSTSDINPGSGLPMMDDTVDVAGNPYGFDDSSTDMGSSMDMDISSGIGGLDDW